jgi:hypothetical protein
MAYITVTYLISSLGNINQGIGQTRTSEYIRSGSKCPGGVSIFCGPVMPAGSPDSSSGTSKRYDAKSRSVC